MQQTDSDSIYISQSTARPMVFPSIAKHPTPGSLHGTSMATWGDPCYTLPLLPSQRTEQHFLQWSFRQSWIGFSSQPSKRSHEQQASFHKQNLTASCQINTLNYIWHFFVFCLQAVIYWKVIDVMTPAGAEALCHIRADNLTMAKCKNQTPFSRKAKKKSQTSTVLSRSKSPRPNLSSPLPCRRSTAQGWTGLHAYFWPKVS